MLLVRPSASLSLLQPVVVCVIVCGSCAWPIIANPASTEACEIAQTRSDGYVAIGLALDAMFVLQSVRLPYKLLLWACS